jgi:hypothetical protein
MPCCWQMLTVTWPRCRLHLSRSGFPCPDIIRRGLEDDYKPNSYRKTNGEQQWTSSFSIEYQRRTLKTWPVRGCTESRLPPQRDLTVVADAQAAMAEGTQAGTARVCKLRHGFCIRQPAKFQNLIRLSALAPLGRGLRSAPSRRGETSKWRGGKYSYLWVQRTQMTEAIVTSGPGSQSGSSRCSLFLPNYRKRPKGRTPQYQPLPQKRLLDFTWNQPVSWPKASFSRSKIIPW